MLTSKVTRIALAQEAQNPLVSVESVMLLAGEGLEGDRYCQGMGSYQKGQKGKRQLTLIDQRHLQRVGYTLEMSRRNVEVVGDVDLMRLFTADGGIEFDLGEARCRGLKYCDPCNIPSKLAGVSGSFRDDLWGCGGLIVEVVTSGRIWVGCDVTADIPKYD